MVTKIDLINSLNKILNPKIGYCPINKKYIVDGIWDTDFSLDFFEQNTYNFEKNLLDNITNFTSPKNLIIELYDIIWDKIDWYTKNEIQNFSFFKVISKRIIEYENLAPILLDDKYNIDFVRGFDSEKDYFDVDDLSFLILKYKKETNNYLDEKDLEKTKLINALQIHFESINLLYNALYKIEMNFEELDLQAISSSASYRNLKLNPLKCNIDLNKLETAILFRFLMDKGMFFMDKNQNKNKVKLQNFFEQNFNFTSEDGVSYPITRLNNDLVKISFDNRLDIQLSTLQSLINSLTQYKKNIETKHLKKKSP
jgi:hypothetical protein